MSLFKKSLLLVSGCLLTFLSDLSAQELRAKVSVNYSQISSTKTSVFEALEKNLTAFMNDRQWTGQKYTDLEKINCTFGITLSQYNEAENSFTAQLQVQSTRPVYNSTYTSTVFNFKDNQFNFNFQEFDQLNFNIDQVDNNLTAMMAYYAYLIIGMDMDTMAPMGGTEVLRMAETVVTNAQNLGFEGWKAFDDSKNRFSIINDYLDGAMEPFRQMQYQYYRMGLDIMADQPDQGRIAIMEALEQLDKAHKNKTLSQLPQIFTDYKRDEIVNVFAKKGTPDEKQRAYDIVFGINASQSNYWDKIKQ